MCEREVWLCGAGEAVGAGEVRRRGAPACACAGAALGADRSVDALQPRRHARRRARGAPRQVIATTNIQRVWYIPYQAKTYPC
jgi:hypothetical protein